MNELSPKSFSTHFSTSTLKAWEGALWKILSCAAFAGINGIVRYLSGGAGMGTDNALPTHVILFFQNVLGTLFLLPIIWRSGLHTLTTRHPLLHLVRVITAVLGISLWYLTLKYMPIAEGVALSFTGPVFTIVGASLLLSEKIGIKRIIAITLSLLGAFIITRPDLALWGSQTELGMSALLPLCSAIALAWNKLLTRKLAQAGETAESLATYLLLLMIPASFVPAAFDWVWPNAHHWIWIFSLGLLAAIAHLSFVKAYALAEVTFLTPFGFSKFLFSTLVGFYFFSEIPSQSLWIGMAVIASSIFLLAYKIKIPLYAFLKRLKASV